MIVRPHITLVVLGCVAALCALLMFVFPQEGVMIGNVKLRFPTWSALSDTTANNKIEDVEKYLAQLDSLSAADSLNADSVLHVQRVQLITSLQFKDNDASSFYQLFEALDSAQHGLHVHVLHYGDSQIECDRMSGNLREKLQIQFGGNGPGLVSPLPLAATSHCSQSNSGNWKRHTSYGFDDGKIPHNKFGAMCSFARFTPALKSKADIDSTQTHEAWFEMRPSGMAQPHSKIFHEATMYLGNHHLPFTLTVKADDQIISEQKIEVGIGMQMLKWKLESTPKKIRFIFSGADSPDVYAVALNDVSGVSLSNIALRGNDGKALNRVNSAEMQGMMDDAGADLLILQFGGNAVPYLKNETAARAYGKAFQSQIQYMKRCAPGAAILVTGPSDMSTSIDGVMRTWPFLAELNEGMKEAAFAEGCAFWDMFNVMGGENSMVSWVKNSPPYAGPDYTHFTPAGARKMAELMYKAIADEYQLWQNAQSGI
ncbi:MAG: GDSL-type esterase/lipase family protein [Flavobacteriales bacterium]